eukprot:CAMPEP_0174732606 /NCGR_PEP_ID=MMETSP1094-20130205/59694_1 /TAXON_ID=156173 /ORGANISM="Chrysochromulina brevifilum, Strain UTEX LB 985" /LENGTH=33 /DNA_ID= /DNA_START= /DNA_END= /DNA_ORIENTATION=
MKGWMLEAEHDDASAEPLASMGGNAADGKSAVP